jgi:hypothetical protein
MDVLGKTSVLRYIVTILALARPGPPGKKIIQQSLDTRKSVMFFETREFEPFCL